MNTYIFQCKEAYNRVKMIDADNETEVLEKLEERLKRGFENATGNIQYDNVSDYKYCYMM